MDPGVTDQQPVSVEVEEKDLNYSVPPEEGLVCGGDEGQLQAAVPAGGVAEGGASLSTVVLQMGPCIIMKGKIHANASTTVA